MSTELAPVGLPKPAELQTAWNIASKIASTEFVPSDLQGRPEAVLAAVLAGRELGVGPLQSLAKIHIIDGKPTVAPELMMALVLRAGHTIHISETTDEKCAVVGIRANTPIALSADEKYHTEVVWTLDDAVRAGLCELREGKPYARSQKGKPLSWEKYPRAMLRSRAVSELCRAVFPDVLAGFSYTPEELGAEVDEEGQPIDVPVAASGNAGPVAPAIGPSRETVASPPAPTTTLQRVDMATGEVVGQPNIDEPPYAPGPDDRQPNASQLAERVKTMGADWLQLLQDVKRNADDEGIDVPPRTGDIDKKAFHLFRTLLQRHVEELEKAKGGQQETLA